MRRYILLCAFTLYGYGYDHLAHTLYHRTQELHEAASHKNMTQVTTRLQTIAAHLYRWPMYPHKNHPMPLALAYASLEKTRKELAHVETRISQY